jgi:superfamily II DNA or RNA helicase
MATGTGKTLLSTAIARLYLRTENATRILFLMDRLELEDQAWKNFNAYLLESTKLDGPRARAEGARRRSGESSPAATRNEVGLPFWFWRQSLQP